MQQSVIGRAAVDLAVRKIWANFGEPSEPYDLNKQGIYEAQIFPHNDVGSFFMEQQLQVTATICYK